MIFSTAKTALCFDFGLSIFFMISIIFSLNFQFSKIITVISKDEKPVYFFSKSKILIGFCLISKEKSALTFGFTKFDIKRVPILLMKQGIINSSINNKSQKRC